MSDVMCSFDELDLTSRALSSLSSSKCEDFSTVPGLFPLSSVYMLCNEGFFSKYRLRLSMSPIAFDLVNESIIALRESVAFL